MRMLNQRDAYTSHYLHAATELILGQLDSAGRGMLRIASVSREDERDVFCAEFTLATRPGVVFSLRRTAYSPELEAKLSADSAVSTLAGQLTELIHLPAGEPSSGVVAV